VHTLTDESLRSSALSVTHDGLTHTDAKQFSAASLHSWTMSACEASGLSSVWSMRAATPLASGGQNPGEELARVAPTENACWTSRPQWSGTRAPGVAATHPGVPAVERRSRA
jgi:hypothetical protein